GHSQEMPWYVKEVPTIAVSLNYTNHLYDVPMMKTFINAYGDTPEYLHALVEKITGKSEFKGEANELVWCGRWDTRC
nr:glycosyl hydrolase [Lachnospiraceae bacterium]